MASYATLLLTCFLLLVLSTNGTGTIHRAKKARPGVPLPLHNPGGSGNMEQAGGHSQETWLYAIISAMLVGLSGIFPLLVIPIEAGKALRKGVAGQRLKLLLSFAVGGLLGDVFLHLLPEAWQHIDQDNHRAHTELGLWVLAGLLSFLVVEKIFPNDEDEDEEGEEKNTKRYTADTLKEGTKIENICSKSKNKKGNRKKGSKGDASINGQGSPSKVYSNNNGHANGYTINGAESYRQYNGNAGGRNNHHSSKNGCHVSNEKSSQQNLTEKQHIKTSGWLNLLANVIDNFTHGLAVAGSYCVSTKSGVITTIIILLHEIPHEVGDFAILLKSGFDRWKAAQCQLLTATGGILGAITALAAESAQEAGNRTAWILPFTSGGFIYVALVTVVPDLLKETDPWESLLQVVCLLGGILSMAAVALWLDEHDLPTVEWIDSSFTWLKSTIL